MPQGPAQQGQPEAGPAGAQVADTSGGGGGQTGVGMDPAPGEPGFSGNVA